MVYPIQPTIHNNEKTKSIRLCLHCPHSSTGILDSLFSFFFQYCMPYMYIIWILHGQLINSLDYYQMEKTNQTYIDLLSPRPEQLLWRLEATTKKHNTPFEHHFALYNSYTTFPFF